LGRAERVRKIERIEPGGEVAARAIGGDELEHAGLLLRLHGVAVAGRLADRAVALGRGDACDRAGVADVVGGLALDALEKRAPLRRDARGIAKPALVEVFDEGCIAARKGRSGLEQL